MFRVLLVENDPLDNYITLNLLNRSGLDLVLSVVTNGHEALKRLQHTRPLPDVILLDLHMPVLDGFEFISRVRKTLTEAEMKPIKIIVLSTPIKNQTHDAAKLGVHAVLTKPLDLEAFRVALSA